MKRILFVLLALMGCIAADACTSAIVSGKFTRSGRPLLWKNRDTSDQNNRVEFVRATRAGNYDFVALFDARDARDTAAWTGFNARGFAIMNTASYNLNKDNVPAKDMDCEGVVMRLALETCVTVDDFEALLKRLPKPLGVEANFGVIDAQGHGAYFEAGNYTYVKYDLADEPSGVLTRTNYSYSGRSNEGQGYIREQNARALLAPHIAQMDITPAVFTEELSRTFYNSLVDKDYTHSGQRWIVDQDYIPRRSSTASIVIEGVLPGEDPLLTTMWTVLGYPPCGEMIPVWMGEGGVPASLRGQGKNRHSSQCDKVLARKARVFSVKRGNGNRYLHLSELFNAGGTGIAQELISKNLHAYEEGYREIARRRAELSKKKK